MKVKEILTLSATACIFFAAKAQEKYRLLNWTVDNGLSMNRCHAMMKDSTGFLWITTQVGLNRFDGNSFKIYFADKKKHGSLAGSRIAGIVEDSLHNIWVGTDKGLSRYDIKADTFKNFYPDIPTAGSNSFIIPFSTTQNDVYCLEPEFKITAYNIHSFAKRILTDSFYANVGYDFSMPSSSVFDEASNSAWMIDGAGLLEISLSDGHKTHHALPLNKTHKGDFHATRGMCYDHFRNTIWLSTTEGLLQFQIRNKEFKWVPALENIEKVQGFDMHEGIYVDHQGRVWFCNNRQGLMMYDPDKESIAAVFRDSTQQRKVSEAVYSIYCDKEGSVWIGTSNMNGLYQLIPYSQCLLHYEAKENVPGSLSSKYVSNIKRGPNGTMWVTTPNGLNILDIKANSFSVLKRKDMPGISGESLISLAMDTSAGKAWLWVNDKKSMFEMDINTKKCREVIFKDPMNNTISPDSYDYFTPVKHGYLVHVNTHGVFAVNKDSAVAHEIISMPNLKITRIEPIGEDVIFLRLFGSAGSITYRKNNNGNWIKSSCPLDSVIWNCIWYNESDKTCWAAGRNLLTHYDKNFKVIREYLGGEQTATFNISNITSDGYGTIWVVNPTNIARLDTTTGKIILLSEKDGYQKQKYNWISPVATDIYGNVYLGPVGTGFDKVEPQNFVSEYPPVKVYLQSLEVNHQSYSTRMAVDAVTHLRLKYFQNNFSIQAGIMDYYSQGKGNNRIRYKLTGVEKNWQYAPSNFIIRYAGLPPGSYSLVIQASNANDDWNGPSKILIVHISPPFWKTWWFILLIVLLIAAAINALFRFRLRQKMLVHNVRQKLHRDLHDDVGATLSSIKVYTEMLQNNPDGTLISELIKSNAIDMIDKLEIIAWATNPQHDSFKSFRDLINKYASAICHTKNIDFNLQSDGVNENMIMPGDVRQNLLLICKEAINNIIKYSEASKCAVRLFIKDRKFHFTISDNGKGFSGSIKGSGTGWKNMQKRTQELNGIIKIESEQNNGTIIDVGLPYPFKIPSLWDKSQRSL